MIFTLKLRVWTCDCKVSQLQLLDMRLLETLGKYGDSDLNMYFELNLTYEQIQSLDLVEEFRKCSTVEATKQLRRSKDIEEIIPLFKLVDTFDYPAKIFPTLRGSIPYSEENVKTLLTYMSK